MLALGLAMCTCALKGFAALPKYTSGVLFRMSGKHCICQGPHANFSLSADCVLISVMFDSGLYQNAEFSCPLSI